MRQCEKKENIQRLEETKKNELPYVSQNKEILKEREKEKKSQLFF